MPNTLGEADWELLLRRIKNGKCTPFIGAGACWGVLPTGAEIARDWAASYKYPLDCTHELAKIAQYIAVRTDQNTPKEMIQERFKNITPPDFTKEDEIHGILATLPISTYITTNYDNFMSQALQSRNKAPVVELCRWNNRIHAPPALKAGYVPSQQAPLVYHLHGHIDVLDSIVITEDDYIDFLLSLKRPNLLPPCVEEAFAGTTLLFLGYRLADWDFRVIFRSLVSYRTISGSSAHISVQILPMGESFKDADRREIQDIFDKYFRKSEIRVYWGTCQEFVMDLRKRWEAYNHG